MNRRFRKVNMLPRAADSRNAFGAVAVTIRIKHSMNVSQSLVFRWIASRRLYGRCSKYTFIDPTLSGRGNAGIARMDASLDFCDVTVQRF